MPEADLRQLDQAEARARCSRGKSLPNPPRAIGDRLGNEGYAFANVNAVPELDKEADTSLSPCSSIRADASTVSRINIAGNTTHPGRSDSPRDPADGRRVVRRTEDPPFKAADRPARLLQRGQRRDAVRCTGTTDQVDVNMSVSRRPTGNVLFGAGFSSADKIILSASVSQNNIFGIR